MGNAGLKDLCSTCIHEPTCVRRAGQSGPIWFCEEFDDSQPASKVRQVPSSGKRKSMSAGGNSNIKIGNRALGLCSNCKNRDTCTYPRPNGGVWHCEDYE